MCTYRMRLNFSGMKLSRFSQFRRASANSLIIREYFEQVLQNYENGHRTMPCAPLSPLYWIVSTNTDDALIDIS